MRTQRPVIVGIGGTKRPGSSSEMTLRFTLNVAEGLGAQIEGFYGKDLLLPLFDPEEPLSDYGAERLVCSLRRADGIIVASPGYHGSVSGPIKNAIDYVELMKDDERPYFAGRAVGCIACAAGWQATGTTLVTLRAIVHALRGWPTPLGVMVNTVAAPFSPDGRCRDPALSLQLCLLARQVYDFACRGACA
ncbi:MAG: NADPH-dependent FMN reductase [Steroidobacteraceae bacterium]